MKKILLLLGLAVFINSCSTQLKNKEEWIQLFNGENLDNWVIKIKGSPLHENYKETFRVEDGLLKVNYDNYESFNGEFGHLYTKQSYSHYKLRVEYRFVGEQVQNGPSWAYRNNGLMLHAQSAESMELDQDFPTSIEAQILGGIGDDDRTNMNVCSPGSIFDFNGKPYLNHCLNSHSKVMNGEDWRTVELEVLGDSIIKHFINGELVMKYTNIRLDPDSPTYNKLVSSETGARMVSGKIAIQAESHPTHFRKIELLDLSDEYCD